MWPHLITIGLGDKAIVVGTDAAEVITTLDGWRIDNIGEPVDFCLELDPAPSGLGKPRPLPGLYHGAKALLRTQDTTRLTTTFLRVLASYSRPAAEGQVRVALMPVIRDGAAMLVPRGGLGTVPDRWLLSQGLEALYTVSSLVDGGKAQVLVDPPLGSNEEPAALHFGGWWLPARHWNGALSPGFAVAAVMTLVTDVSAANATTRLRTVAGLVERAHPTFAPSTVEAIKDGLIQALPPAPSP